MTIDRGSRRKLEALRFAGIEFLPRDRLVAAAALPSPVSLEAPSAPLATSRPSKSDSQPMAPITLEAAVPENALPAHLDPLEVLRQEVAGCRKCSILAETRMQTVFSDGSRHAELCFVGEAPGADEDVQGVPFVGKAGQLLTKIIEACKLSREEVYICNVLKCRPPGNRNPMPDEVECCRPYLERQLAIVQPKMLVALGKFAAAYLLNKRPEDTPITRLRGQIHEYCGIPVMITLHPAYLLRNPAAKREVWEDMKTVMRQLGRPVDGM